MSMRAFGVASAAIVLHLIAPLPAALADCEEDMRRLELSSDNVVRLRSYNCRAGGGNGEFHLKVEFHRLSDVAAGLVIDRRPSPLLTKALGPVQVVENPVYRAYADLLDRFGMTVELAGQDYGSQVSIRIDGAGKGGSTQTQTDPLGGRIRVLTGYSTANEHEYPAIDEGAAIRKRTIPKNLKFTYAVACHPDNVSGSRLADLCPSGTTAHLLTDFWRPMTPNDVAAFPARMAARNRSFSDRATHLPTGIPRELAFLNYLAGQHWPEDLVILTGRFGPQGCDGGSWSFSMRPIILDATIIENVSARTVRLDGVIGALTTESGLRASSAASSPAMIKMPQVLEPGAKLLIPTRITLVPPTAPTAQQRRVSQEIYRRIGSNGFRGNSAAHGFPSYRNYIYGPDMSVSGVVVDDRRIDFNRRAANFIDMAVSAEQGSCPFLLTRTASDQTWIEHGKVLHKAPSQAQEYEESRTFPGFRKHVRLEEREAEIAHIDRVALDVALHDGRTFTLAPDHTALAARDGNYLRLYWGDAIDVAFMLPTGTAEGDVVESTIRITGYYERYAALEVGNEKPSTIAPRRTTASIPGSIAREPPLTCPAVPRAPRRLLLGFDRLPMLARD
ncbi:MAG: hypothetical protein IT536_08530 [Hyphomicrobiales bacterium]|nr:hypothetical protein [Hyphomicrobiales bacterium]